MGERVDLFTEMTECPAIDDIWFMDDRSVPRTKKITHETFTDKVIYFRDVNAHGGFTAAVAAVGSNNAVLGINDTQTHAGNLSVPDNVKLKYGPSGLLSITSGVVTFNNRSQIIADPRQPIFSGAGSVAFTLPGITPAPWWGATGTAIWKAIQAGSTTGTIVYVPAMATTYQYSGQWDIAALAKPVKLIGEYSRDQDLSVIEFIHTDSSNCVVFASNFDLENIRFKGNSQTGHGFYTVGAGGCVWRNVDIRDFGTASHDGLNATAMYIAEFYNVNIRNNGRDNVHLVTSNENRAYSCKFPRATRYDLYLDDCNGNIFDYDGGNEIRDYSFYVNKGYGNQITTWNDGETLQVGYLGKYTTKNYIRAKGNFTRSVDDYGFGNRVEVSFNHEIAKHLSDARSIDEIKNWLRNSSALQGHSGWSASALVTKTSDTTTGLSTGTSFKIAFAGALAGTTSFMTQTDLETLNADDIIVVKFGMKTSRALAVDEFIGIQVGGAGSTMWPDRGGAYIRPTTSWQSFTLALRAEVGTAAAVLYFKSIDIDSAVDVHITDIMFAVNPSCPVEKVPFIYSGTILEYATFPIFASRECLPMTMLPPLDAEPTNKRLGNICHADGYGTGWDPLSKATDASYLVIYAQVVLRGSVYKWTASGAGTDEYHCELTGAGDPSLTLPSEVFIDGVSATKGTLGALNAGEWGYGDNDVLGYNTVYVRLSDGTDPDAKVAGYIIARRWAAIDGTGA